MLKSDLLLSQPAGILSHYDALLGVKELVLTCFLLPAFPKVLLGREGDRVHMVIVMEGLSQDELSGSPVCHLLVFAPSRPFPANNLLSCLPADQSEIQMNRASRELFLAFVKLLGGRFQPFRECGKPGRATRVCFPPLFHSRHRTLQFAAQRSKLSLAIGLPLAGGPGRELIAALKAHGDTLMKQEKYTDAAFAYT